MVKTIINKYLNYFDRSQENDKFCIYIDFPFCLSDCNYCIYHSLNFNQYKNRINEYADSVLKQLADCKELFERRKPDTIYFGGGTPNLWSFDALGKIKSFIPNYDSIKSVKAELHPYNLDRDTIDFWVDIMKLNIASIGVQSFDKVSCQKQHRIWVSKENIRMAIKYFHLKNIWVNIDLVALFGGDSVNNWDVYEKDIKIACEELKPDVITTIPNYRTTLNYYEQVRIMRAILKRECGKEYFPINSIMLSSNMDDILKYGKNDHWIATEGYWNFINKNIKYSCSGIASGKVPKNQITLGFGGCGEHRCYSYLPDNSYKFYSFYDYDIGGYHYQYMEL